LTDNMILVCKPRKKQTAPLKRLADNATTRAGPFCALRKDAGTE
jgi:hypothetical protein